MSTVRIQDFPTSARCLIITNAVQSSVYLLTGSQMEVNDLCTMCEALEKVHHISPRVMPNVARQSIDVLLHREQRKNSHTLRHTVYLLCLPLSCHKGAHFLAQLAAGDQVL